MLFVSCWKYVPGDGADRDRWEQTGDSVNLATVDCICIGQSDEVGDATWNAETQFVGGYKRLLVGAPDRETLLDFLGFLMRDVPQVPEASPIARGAAFVDPPKAN